MPEAVAAAVAEGKKNSGVRVLLGRYVLGDVLGEGSFGLVHAARDLRTGRSVAVKEVKKKMLLRCSGMAEQMKMEIAIMKRVAHPNVVELHEVMATRSRIYLAMELLRGGDLLEAIIRRGRVGEEDARRYFRQIISAVDFCHSRGVCHRDLKPENLLLDEAGKLLKVADFGLSALVDGGDAGADGLLHDSCGTQGYAAPEVARGEGYDGAKADLWSCGVILYMLLTGAHPFPDNDVDTQYKKIRRRHYWRPKWFSSLKEANDLVFRLLDPKPATRITMAELLETPWFNKTTIGKPITPEPAIDPECAKAKDEPKTLNAFHLISLSEGFDLSLLFEGDGAGSSMLFATMEPASIVVSRVEEVAARGGGGRMRVTGSGPWGVRLEGAERAGCRGKARLAVAVEIFSVAPAVLVVEVKKEGGDALEYRAFCSEELRPALQGIVLTAAA